MAAIERLEIMDLRTVFQRHPHVQSSGFARREIGSEVSPVTGGTEPDGHSDCRAPRAHGVDAGDQVSTMGTEDVDRSYRMPYLLLAGEPLSRIGARSHMSPRFKARASTAARLEACAFV